MSNKKTQLNSSGIIKPELVKEFLQNKRLKEKRKEKIYTVASVFVALAFILFFASLNAVSVRNQTVAINKSTINSKDIVVQKTQNIAGQPTHWVKIVPLSEISKDKNLIVLPKNATNINIKVDGKNIALKQPKTTNQDRINLLASIIDIKASESQKQNGFASLLDSVKYFFVIF